MRMTRSVTCPDSLSLHLLSCVTVVTRPVSEHCLVTAWSGGAATSATRAAAVQARRAVRAWRKCGPHPGSPASLASRFRGLGPGCYSRVPPLPLLCLVFVFERLRSDWDEGRVVAEAQRREPWRVRQGR